MKSTTYLSLLAGLVILPADFAQAQRLYRPNYSNYSGTYQAFRPDYYPSHLTPGLNSPVGLARPGAIEAAIRGYYIAYLGREPEPGGVEAWVVHAYNTGSLREARVGILASHEYFVRAGGNPAGFVESLFHDIADRPPRRQELNYWVDDFHAHRGDRAELIREILATFRQ